MPDSKRIFALGNRYLVGYLAFLSAFTPLATDMYLPALPVMSENLHVGNDLISLSISLFMLLFAFSMLCWGPLSDRYGRRPILVAGCLIFIISSGAIALCHSIWTLLFWRCAQAIGAGATSTVALAVVKDTMRGVMMEKVVSWMQAAMILAPMLAPVLGGWLLLVISWRGIFWFLLACGALALAGSFALKETCSKNAGVSLFRSFSRIGHVLQNRHFLKPLLLFSAMSMPFMSYLAVSSFIFQDEFHVSAQAYSLFFAFNACFSLLGPIAHLYVFRRMPRNMVLAGHLLVMCIAGCLLLAFGTQGPWWFALLFAPSSFCGSAMRSPSTVLMMESIQGDNGVVTSLINCGALLCGSLSMLLASLPFWPNPVLAVGALAAVVSGVCFIAWMWIRKEY